MKSSSLVLAMRRRLIVARSFICPLLMCSCYDLPFSLLFPLLTVKGMDWRWSTVPSQTFICFYISEDDREQWKKGLLQGLNNASAQTYILAYLRILQQRTVTNKSVVCLHVFFLIFVYMATSIHFKFRFTQWKLACMCLRVLFTSIPLMPSTPTLGVAH